MMENSNVAMFNDKGQVETLTQSQYNYDQRIAVMSADEKAKYLQKTEKLDRHDMTTVTSYGKELSSVISRNVGKGELNGIFSLRKIHFSQKHKVRLLRFFSSF